VSGVNFIILAHQAPDQLARLTHRLAHPNVRCFVHVDARTSLAPFEAGLASQAHVHLLRNRVACAWADFSLVEATNRCIDEVLRSGNEGHTVLLSGQDYPLHSVEHIVAFFARDHSVDYMEAKKITRDDQGFFAGHYQRHITYRFNVSHEPGEFVLLPPLFSREWLTYATLWGLLKVFARSERNRRTMLSWPFLRQLDVLRERRQPPLPFYGGSQWWALSHRTLTKTRAYCVANPQIDAFHRYSQVPDEHYYHSVVAHLAQQDPSIRLAPPLTYTTWLPYHFNPTTFVDCPEHVAELQRSAATHLFARKLDMRLDTAIFARLDALAETPTSS
jgi:hypothetical protein